MTGLKKELMEMFAVLVDLLITVIVQFLRDMSLDGPDMMRGDYLI